MAKDRDETGQAADQSQNLEPTSSASSQTAEQLFETGWQHYSKKEYYRAEADFQKSLELSPGNGDVMYGLGMAVSASGRREEAIKIFEKAIELFEQNKNDEDRVRGTMLTHLARGHINRIRTGDWRLEK